MNRQIYPGLVWLRKNDWGYNGEGLILDFTHKTNTTVILVQLHNNPTSTIYTKANSNKRLFFFPYSIIIPIYKQYSSKGTIFYPDKFVFANFWGISIEWMKPHFFSFRVLFFSFSAPKIEWMNDMWTFPRKKKPHKNTQKYGRSKNNTLLLKIKGLRQNLNEWPINFTAERKKHIKITSGFLFFSHWERKKNKIFWFEWLNGPRTYRWKWKYTVPLIAVTF